MQQTNIEKQTCICFGDALNVIHPPFGDRSQGSSKGDTRWAMMIPCWYIMAIWWFIMQQHGPKMTQHEPTWPKTNLQIVIFAVHNIGFFNDFEHYIFSCVGRLGHPHSLVLNFLGLLWAPRGPPLGSNGTLLRSSGSFWGFPGGQRGLSCNHICVLWPPFVSTWAPLGSTWLHLDNSDLHWFHFEVPMYNSGISLAYILNKFGSELVKDTWGPLGVSQLK